MVPHPFLLHWSVSWSRLGNWNSSWDSNRFVVLDDFWNSIQQFLQGKFHLNTWEGGVSDLDVVRVEFNDIFGLVGVRERTGIEIRQQSTDRQYQISRFYSLLNFWSRQGTNVNTTVSWVLFVNSTLTHWGDVNWELSQVHQLLSFSLDIMSRSTSISQDNWVLSILDQFNNSSNNFSFSFSVVWLQRQVNWSFQ
uniref:L3137 protein n=1 Tax=Saccharomyces cerevisiae TaxID=4932 RepID=E9PAA1_YEASX|nr:L3137 [Saccharomyces cerevisiae]